MYLAKWQETRHRRQDFAFATTSDLLRTVVLHVLRLNFDSYGKLEAKRCKLGYQEDGSIALHHYVSYGLIVLQGNAVKIVLVYRADFRRCPSRIMGISWLH